MTVILPPPSNSGGGITGGIPSGPQDLSKMSNSDLATESAQIAQISQQRAAKGEKINPLSQDTIQDQLTMLKDSGVQLTPAMLNMLEMGTPILMPPNTFDPKSMALFVVVKNDKNSLDPTQSKYNLFFNPNPMVALVNAFYQLMMAAREGKLAELKLDIQQLQQYWEIAKEQGQMAYQMGQTQSEMDKDDAYGAIAAGVGSALGGLTAFASANQMKAQLFVGLGEITKGYFGTAKAGLQVDLGAAQQVKALLDALSNTTQQQWQNAASAWRSYTDQWAQAVELLNKIADANAKAAAFQ